VSTKGRSTKDRVQGIDSRLADLTLRDGRRLAVEVGSSVVPTPMLKRTIEGSSSVSLEVYDPELKFLQAAMLAEKFDAEIDDLHFRYVGTSKSGRNLTITLEDRGIALLREAKGPDKVLAHRGKPNEVTRAEYIKALVKKAAPHLTFICPQLHDKQPIAKPDKAKKANEEAKDRREKGIGAAKHLTVDGAPASPAQKHLGEEALRIADSFDAPQIVEVAVIAALMTESSMGEASPGNVLQALEPYTKVRPAAQEISGFIAGEPTWTGVTAIGYAKSHPEATFYEIAQAVQKSGAGESTNGAGNYGKFGDEARAWVEAFGGEGGEVGSETVKEPRTFEVKKGEDYWTAIKRMAKEVNWRAFVVGERFYFIDELELARGMVRLAIDRDTPGIPPANVDFDFNVNKKVTEVKLNKVPVKQWKPPPGSVVTLEGYGPASLGFGDAPVKANAKGQKAGLSSNRNAKTGEGRGRYLVASIESPLTESSDSRLATITLKKPTAPLPEPAPKTKTVSAGGASGNMPQGIADAIDECDRINAAEYPYSSPGARGAPPPKSGPFDCSGVTSRISYVASGEPASTLASAELAQSFEAGKGEWLTIYAKGPDGPSGHAWLEIKTPQGWRPFGTSSSNPGGGAGWIDPGGVSDSYRAEFQKRHPKGL
jgi:hypothetical protein